jgi:hypothetical protein
MVLTLGVAATVPAPSPSISTDASSASAPAAKTIDGSGPKCPSKEAVNIVVCAQRRQSFRLDSDVIAADRQIESNSRSASSATPPAQAVCATSPAGCGIGLESLDLANIALVAGAMAVSAATGKDWLKPFKTGGPGEYQLYRRAKQMREAQETERAAAEMKRKAREAERDAAAAATGIDSK